MWSEQFAQAIDVEPVLGGRIGKGIGDVAGVGLGVEEVRNGALDRHGGQAIDGGDVAWVELALSVADLAALALSASGADEVVAAIPEVADAVESRCGRPSEDNATLAVIAALVSHALGVGAEPGSAEVIELIAGCSGVLVHAVRETLQVSGLGESREVALNLSAHLQVWPADWMLSEPAGQQMGPWQLQRAFRAARDDVAKTDPTLPAGIRFHDLRHFYAFALIAAGLDIKIVQARLRHASAKTALDTYGHMFPHSDDSTRAPSRVR